MNDTQKENIIGYCGEDEHELCLSRGQIRFDWYPDKIPGGILSWNRFDYVTGDALKTLIN